MHFINSLVARIVDFETS